MQSRALPRRTRGFSLIELAVVMFISAILLGAILGPLTTQVAQRKASDTQKTLEEIKEALLGYAIANGRLPCPASSTSNGVESFAPGGSAADGNCSNFFDGFLPAATLGSSPVDAQGYALDAWGQTQNRIRYAVSNQTIVTVTNPFTSVNGMRNATIASIAANPLLVVCSNGAGATATACGTTTNACNPVAATTLTSNAPAVIWSVGANAATTGGISIDEKQNPNPDPTNAGFSADRIFVYHPPNSITGCEFDDIVTWLSGNVLISRMVAAGQLP